MTIESIREKLFNRKIKLLPHAINSMRKRGYTKEDIIHGIMNGEITGRQMAYGQLRVIIESIDTDRNPIVLVLTKDREQPEYYSVITTFPPIKNKFKRCI